MLKHFARKLAICSTIFALITPVALAAGSPLGTDPEPEIVHTMLALLGIGLR
jgi:hypothetical protein